MSISPRFSAASLVASSGITFSTSRFTRGVPRQYWSNASSTNSTPGSNETNLYGPAPIGRLPEAVVADLFDVFARHDPTGTGGAGVEGEEVGPWLLQFDPYMQRIGRLDRVHALLQHALELP